jgi:hypothetical protein
MWKSLPSPSENLPSPETSLTVFRTIMFSFCHISKNTDRCAAVNLIMTCRWARRHEAVILADTWLPHDLPPNRGREVPRFQWCRPMTALRDRANCVLRLLIHRRGQHLGSGLHVRKKAWTWSSTSLNEGKERVTIEELGDSRKSEQQETEGRHPLWFGEVMSRDWATCEHEEKRLKTSKLRRKMQNAKCKMQRHNVK